VIYTRDEIQSILEARKEAQENEGAGENAWLDFKLRVTPELLGHLMSGSFVSSDGRICLLQSVEIDAEGYAHPRLLELERKS
jgi:hypothetical protein